MNKIKVNQCENNFSLYPQWICKDCAINNSGIWPEGHHGSFHGGVCGWCEEEKGVTQPRDWGYPIYLGG